MGPDAGTSVFAGGATFALFANALLLVGVVDQQVYQSTHTVTVVAPVVVEEEAEILVNSTCGANAEFAERTPTFTQQGGILMPEDPITELPYITSVSLSDDGDRMAVMSKLANNYTGAVYMYARTGSVWARDGARLVGTGVPTTLDTDNIITLARLSGDGRTLAVLRSNFNADLSGVWVWYRNATGSWIEQAAALTVTDGFDATVTLHTMDISHTGSRIVVTSETLLYNTTIYNPDDASTGQGGAVWTFDRTGDTWAEVGTVVKGPAQIPDFTPVLFDRDCGFGTGVALSKDGDAMVVTATAVGTSVGNGLFFTYAWMNNQWNKTSGPVYRSNLSAPLRWGDHINVDDTLETLFFSASDVEGDQPTLTAPIYIVAETTDGGVTASPQWCEMANANPLLASEADTVAQNTMEFYGIGVTGDGALLARQQYSTTVDGKVLVFRRTGTTGTSWTLQQTLSGADAGFAVGDLYGVTVSLSGDGTTLAVSANDYNTTGGVVVYTAV